MTKGGMEMVNEARGRIAETTADEVRQLVDRQADVLLLDVREADEVAGGMIPGAHWIPRGFLELKIEALEPRRDRDLVVYCAGGLRSALAADTLRQMGYERVCSMAGGFRGWVEAGHLVQRP